MSIRENRSSRQAVSEDSQSLSDLQFAEQKVKFTDLLLLRLLSSINFDAVIHSLAYPFLYLSHFVTRKCSATCTDIAVYSAHAIVPVRIAPSANTHGCAEHFSKMFSIQYFKEMSKT